ncbi:hypothetical protein GGP56_001329 [Salinibacter ruber]|nr:hypothetical protein [Salinibacter ruber]
MGVRRRRSPGARATGGSVPRRNCPDRIWVFPNKEPSGPDKGGVVLTDIDIGFNDWAVILLKAGLAAFPVAIIALLLYFVLTIAGTALVGGLGG